MTVTGELSFFWDSSVFQLKQISVTHSGGIVFSLFLLVSASVENLNCSLSTWFERASMLVILLNCVTLGMFHPCEDIDCDSERCRILQVRQ